jgi:Putative peptidoglycan binding domain
VWTSPRVRVATDSLPGRYGSGGMSTRDENGREDEDWFDDQEEWQDEPTREKARPRGDGFQLPPPGSPERRRLVLVAVLAGLVLLVIIAAVLASGGDDDEAEPANPTTQAADTAPATTTAPGAGGQVALVPAGAPLAQGDSGPRVRRLQRALNELGYAVGQPDGQYGPATAQAVRSFQEDAGLDADGIAGQQTIQDINQALREGG